MATPKTKENSMERALPSHISPPIANRAELISQLMHDIDERIAMGMSYRPAVRAMSTSTGLSLLTVRRLTRDHPAAPLP